MIPGINNLHKRSTSGKGKNEKLCCWGHNHINKLLYFLCLFSYLVSQLCFSFFFFHFFFLRKKLNNIIKKDRLNQPKIQKKVVVEHPPSTLKVWNINSVSSQTMSNRIQFCHMVVLAIISCAIIFYILLFLSSSIIHRILLVCGCGFLWLRGWALVCHR